MSIDAAAAESRAAEWLQAWDAQAIHRTGTGGDDAGADWLAETAAALGAPVTIETFPLSRIDPIAAYLDIDGTRLAGVPVFDAPPTDALGVTGNLGPIGSDAGIGVVALSPWAVYTEDYRTLRRSTEHLGLVVLCQGSQPGLALLNAEQFRLPYGAPAIQLSSEMAPRVAAASENNAPARLVTYSQRTNATARNVVVTLPGRNASLPPLVVMTPRSSWWQSTSERGGGLVCWLETLRTLLAEPPDRPVILTANSGHELGHLGLDDFIARRSGWDRPDGATWVHYGANIGASGNRLSILSASEDLRTLTQAALIKAGQPPHTMAPITQVPSGETRDIHRAGGRYITLVGNNELFHLPQDRWPHAVDPRVIARIAGGAARLVVTLTR
jgi:hypothetical protein